MKRFAAIKHSFGPWLRSPNTGNTNNVYYTKHICRNAAAGSPPGLPKWD